MSIKISIEREDNRADTEICVKCAVCADDETERVIRLLHMFSGCTIGYRESGASKIVLDDVFYIECVDEKTFLYTADEVFETHKKLYEWERVLEDTAFVRISKTTIINTNRLKSVRPTLNCKMEATMENGEKQMVNRSYVSAFKSKFGL